MEVEPSPACAELPNRILAFIVAFDAAASLQVHEIIESSLSEKSLTFRDQKSDAGLWI